MSGDNELDTPYRAHIARMAALLRGRHWPRGSAITVEITVDGDPPGNGLRARVEEMRIGPDGVATHVQLTMRASEAAKMTAAVLGAGDAQGNEYEDMESSGERPETSANG